MTFTMHKGVRFSLEENSHLDAPALQVLQFQEIFMKHWNQIITKTKDISKGQLISKAIYGVLDSPKKWTKKIWLDIS